MSVAVQLISKPDVDWSAFASITQQTTGSNPLKAAEAKGLDGGAKLVAALEAFRQPTPDPAKALRSANSVLRHLHYSFQVLSDRDTIYEIIGSTPLSVTTAPAKQGLVTAYVSGSLYQFREATVAVCRESASYGGRLLMDKILIIFERLGLAEVWSEYRKVAHPDQTLLLEAKR